MKLLQTFSLSSQILIAISRSLTALALALLLTPSFSVAAPAQRLEAIGEAAVDFVRSNHPWRGFKVCFEQPTLDERLSLSPCEAPLQASIPIGGRIAKRTSIAVKCPTTAGWTIHVSVIANAEASVLVARRAIGRHEQIHANDVMEASRDITTLPYGYLSKLPVGDALQAKSGIAQGAVITPGMTQAADVIKRGDIVAIELSDTRMAISMRGVALADAAVGELVAVKNSQSGRTVQGQAMASGRVRVQ